ncbi:hypothetical protein SAMN04488096_109147 [Mesonia phycicola]|uniref:Uncharacterized protein n=1 Tax=Mesonia phycicola TaxID=579105 RepID=A0A1M6H651_9FLAO|nr:hypothetical protein [Mesonia phycicola]SHJ17664.1 hypothetical protein SAMN04488096_109147 [Mesonia phycicola]
MKNLKNFLRISLILLFFTSCSNDTAIEDSNFEDNQNNIIEADNSVYENENYSDSEIDIYEIERIYYDEATDQEIPVIFQIGITEDDNDLHLFDVSENILELKGITRAEFEAELINVTNGGDEDDPNDGLSPHSKCIEACKDKYTDEDGNKIKGRGSCKANCWVDTAIRLMDAGVPF